MKYQIVETESGGFIVRKSYLFGLVAGDHLRGSGDWGGDGWSSHGWYHYADPTVFPDIASARRTLSDALAREREEREAEARVLANRRTRSVVATIDASDAA